METLKQILWAAEGPTSPQWSDLAYGVGYRPKDGERLAFVEWLETCGIEGGKEAATAIHAAWAKNYPNDQP